ncbi:DNA internalization-related competence protein ComEC/Rec2 [Staphylococcus sp. 17KM0847]|uniref:DNA internalization-related competence protein ComEC/Rec2 n=1 Tax=Staphylococcus sp. 17KM0847 TaxID=2583989 RepID=UPI0015DFC6C7|nr:DNA internalization-related competence protein ComEC/Rec2 [Staphylococcus sp. 17KM0847]
MIHPYVGHHTLSTISTKQRTHLHFDTLPVITGQQMIANASVNGERYRFTLYNVGDTIRALDAAFWSTHVCEVEATLKPPQQIGQTGYISVNTMDISQCKPYKTTSLHLHIQQIRNKIIENIRNEQLPGSQYIIAVSTGFTDFISQAEKQQFRDLGISHLLAVSGTHVGILTALFYRIGKRLPLPIFITQMLLLLILPCFLIFSGATPSAERSVIMAMLAILLSSYIKIVGLHILCLSYILISVYQPELHFHIGFQFSFSICFLLILLQQTYMKQHLGIRLFLSSFVALLGTLPISYQHFNEIQWLSVLTNFFFIPLYSLCIIPMSFLTVMIAWISPSLLSLFNYPFSLFFQIQSKLIALFYPLTQWKMIIADLGEIGYVLIIVFVVICCFLLSKRKFKICLIMVSLLMIVNHVCYPEYQNRMTVIDVGQGDATLFETATGETLMIDTGGEREESQYKHRTSITDAKTYPLLKKRGIRCIDYLVITHPHADHIGELPNLANKLKIRNIMINPNRFDEYYFKVVKNVCESEGAKLISYLDQQYLKLGDFQFSFLNTDIDLSDDLNEHSIITSVQIKQYHLLLMGDATIANEDKLIENYTLPKVDILKVGHHGSKTSSSEKFLDTIHPDIALISAGKSNLYRLPSPIIIDRLQERHIQTYNTADHHHIVVHFDKTYKLYRE